MRWSCCVPDTRGTTRTLLPGTVQVAPMILLYSSIGCFTKNPIKNLKTYQARRELVKKGICYTFVRIDTFVRNQLHLCHHFCTHI
jgi:hypothetical protein